MPPVRKKSAGKGVEQGPGNRRPAAVDPPGRTAVRNGTRTPAERGPARKRGWRDIEAMSERTRLKKLLTDIWHEDIELEEDIFGESDYLAGYYTDSEDEDVAAGPDEEVEYEDFEEDED